MSIPAPIDRHAYFEAIHSLIDDQSLDFCAFEAGSISGVGRMSHLSDELLDMLVQEYAIGQNSRVLDIGCGRGFLARWLQWRGLHVRYVGVDFSACATRAAQRFIPKGTFVCEDYRTLELPERFDVAFAVEMVFGDGLDEQLVRALLQHIDRGGVALATLAAFKSPLDTLISKSVEAAKTAGARVAVRDLTPQTLGFAKRLTEVSLEFGYGPKSLEELARAECLTVLRTMEEGRYGYALLELRSRCSE